MFYLSKDVGDNVHDVCLYFRARGPVRQVLTDRVKYLEVPVHLLVYGLPLICH